MKNVKTLLFFLVLVVIFIGCDKEDESDPVSPPPPPPATTGTIAGTISVPPGSSSSPANTRVAVYANYDDWLNDRTLRTVGADANGNYSIGNLPPGSYYLDAWKDQNGDARISFGDLYNVYGSGTWPNYQLSPISVAAGQTVPISLQLVLI
ncbi:MAG: hypothetical protein C4543_04365 [Ignavibacteriales bacterium]|jgi:hypothetical protein|nr:MAG: hypothetical protein C4543_04365 [Ignavibacteriales bacterium]